MVISKVPPSDPGLETLGTVAPGPLVAPPGGVPDNAYREISIVEVRLKYKTGLTVTVTCWRLALERGFKEGQVCRLLICQI